MKNNLNVNIDKNFNWEVVQKELRHQFGNEIYESWLKKIVFEEKFSNHILVSVSTRFIRDWIVSRYLDQILSIIKKFNKEIIRVEFKIENKIDINKNKIDLISENKISFINESFLQYSRIDQNKSFENFSDDEQYKKIVGGEVYCFPLGPIDTLQFWIGLAELTYTQEKNGKWVVLKY